MRGIVPTAEARPPLAIQEEIPRITEEEMGQYRYDRNRLRFFDEMVEEAFWNKELQRLLPRIVWGFWLGTMIFGAVNSLASPPQEGPDAERFLPQYVVGGIGAAIGFFSTQRRAVLARCFGLPRARRISWWMHQNRVSIVAGFLGSANTLAWMLLSPQFHEANVNKYPCSVRRLQAASRVVGVIVMFFGLGGAINDHVTAFFCILNVLAVDVAFLLAEFRGDMFAVVIDCCFCAIFVYSTYVRREHELTEFAATARLRDEIKAREATEAELVVKSKDALAAAAATKSFLSTMSHEMRTPLHGLSGETLELSQIIMKSAEHLLCTINDVLDLAKAEAGKLELVEQPAEIDEVVADALTVIAHSASEKGIRLVSRIDLPRIGGMFKPKIDAFRLRQVIINLVGNAIKFTPLGGEIVISVKTEEHENSSLLRFKVKDSGSGFDDAVAASLFQPFTQADSTVQRSHGGTGLGLALCRHVVEAWQGEIWGRRRRKAVGAVFSFTVPLVLAKSDTEDLPPTFPPQITKPFLFVASASAVVAEALGEDAVRSGVARGFTTISLPADRNAVATALAAAPPPPGDAMVICNVAIVDLAGPPTIHGGSPNVNALSPDWWTYGRPYSELFQSLHVPVVAIVPLSQATTMPPGVRASLTFPVSSTKLRHAVAQSFGHDIPEEEEEESTRWSPPQSQWPSPPQSLAPIRKHRAHQRPRVLYADDNVINRRVMEMMLHQVGCPVMLAGGGAEGVARATTEPFDLIITDIQMPDVDGFELTRRIRQWEAAHPHIAQRLVIVALTGDMAMSNEETYVSLGFDDFAGKPMSLFQLERLLQKHFPAPPTTP